MIVLTDQIDKTYHLLHLSTYPLRKLQFKLIIRFRIVLSLPNSIIFYTLSLSLYLLNFSEVHT